MLTKTDESEELWAWPPGAGRGRGPGYPLPRHGNVAHSRLHPSAWLMPVARNRAIDLLTRDDQFRYIVPELVHFLRLRDLPGETPGFERRFRTTSSA
jgi:hypothetical protein